MQYKQGHSSSIHQPSSTSTGLNQGSHASVNQMARRTACVDSVDNLALEREEVHHALHVSPTICTKIISSCLTKSTRLYILPSNPVSTPGARQHVTLTQEGRQLRERGLWSRKQRI